MKWLKHASGTILAVLAAVAGILMASRSYKQNARAKNAEQQAINLATSGIKKDLAKASAMNAKAKTHAKKAQAAKQMAESAIDQAAGSNAVLSDVVNSWNSGVQQ